MDTLRTSLTEFKPSLKPLEVKDRSVLRHLLRIEQRLRLHPYPCLPHHRRRKPPRQRMDASRTSLTESKPSLKPLGVKDRPALSPSPPTHATASEMETSPPSSTRFQRLSKLGPTVACNHRAYAYTFARARAIAAYARHRLHHRHPHPRRETSPPSSTRFKRLSKLGPTVAGNHRHPRQRQNRLRHSTSVEPTPVRSATRLPATIGRG